MSPVFHDENSATRRLEANLAVYAGAPDSILCQSGWAANTGLLQAIADEQTPIYLDQLAHMSLWYGAKAAGAPTLPFRHNDPEHLRRKVQDNGPGIIAVDAVYSTHGDLCELIDVSAIATEQDCVLVVDESHSLGVFGVGGATVTRSLQLQGRVDFITASLAKAFAGRAGLIGCPRGFKDYFMMASYPTGFSSSLLEHELVWLDRARQQLVAVEGRRKHLHAISHKIRQKLQQAGIPMAKGSQQIIGLKGGNEYSTLQLRDALEKQGVFAPIFCAPATPARHPLVRLSLHSGITEEQADHLIHSCIKAFSEQGHIVDV
ncbi:CAI-1 autoinducer synthase [compost metagenome]